MPNGTVQLPNGHDFWMRMEIPGKESVGILVLVVTSSISAFAVLCLLGAITLSAWNTRKFKDGNLFVRSHAAGYLVSLLVCDLFQAVGSIMNARWYANKAVTFEPFCTAQGILKQVADVGTAVWALVIACHTFWVLFLRWPLRRPMMIATLVFSWSFIGTIVIAGPASMNMARNGPFWGITGYWCWIAEEYRVSRITLDYMFMFISTFLGFLLYALVFLRLRGNILWQGSRIRFRLHQPSDVDNGLSADDQTIKIAKQMLLYPLAYVALILPIAICRFADWTGHTVSFTATIFSDTIFLLSGSVNVLLFFLTRRVLPRHSIITKRFRKEPSDAIKSNEISRQDFASFIAEKMDEEADSESTFKLVDSPDSGSGDKSAVLSTAQLAVLSSTRLASTTSSTFYGADRASFPASSAGPLLYPQSPLYARGFSEIPRTPPRSDSRL